MIGLSAHTSSDIRTDSVSSDVHPGLPAGVGQADMSPNRVRQDSAGLSDNPQTNERAVRYDSLHDGARADSTQTYLPADSAGHGSAFPGFGADPAGQYGMFPRFGSDSVAFGSGDIVWRDTTARAVFGEQAILVDPASTEPNHPAAPTENGPFQCFVLLLAVTYAVLLYRNLDDIGTLLSRIFHDGASHKRFYEDSGSSGFSRFLHITTVIGILFLGLLAVKFGGWIITGWPTELFADAAVLGLCLATSVTGGLIVLYQHIVLQCAGKITVSQPFIGQLIQLKRTFFALAAVITTPVLLLFVLCPEDSGKIWIHIALAEVSLTALLYIKESLNLFLSKNFSILHWFLYLCTVEFFPISLIWLLITRGQTSI